MALALMSLHLVSMTLFSQPCICAHSVKGLNILSTYKGGRTSTATLSGTSMASPHTAGLLAYLLSIYPHETFDPTFDSEFNVISLQSERIFRHPSSLYSVAHAALPQWISNFLPPPSLVDAVVAPIPKKPETLTPLQLKKAVLKLSSQDLLTDLPDQTVNLLIFNNATAY